MVACRSFFSPLQCYFAALILAAKLAVVVMGKGLRLFVVFPGLAKEKLLLGPFDVPLGLFPKFLDFLLGKPSRSMVRAIWWPVVHFSLRYSGTWQHSF